MDKCKEMEFPLISEQKLVFSDGVVVRSEEDGDLYFVRNASASLENLPKFRSGVNTQEEMKDYQNGSIAIQENPGRKRQRLTYQLQLDKSLIVQISKRNDAGATQEGYLTIWTNKINEDYFDQLATALGGEKLCVDMQLDFLPPIPDDDDCPIHCVTMKRVFMFEKFDSQLEGPLDMIVLVTDSFDFSDPWLGEWCENRKTFSGELTVTLMLNDNHLGGILGVSQGKNQLAAVSKRMQMDTNFTDATLVSGDGKGIKCHKLVLTASSDYFRKMFESKMKEGVTSTVNIPDISYEGLEALLDYLYCQDTTKASKSPSVALELLMKADEYSIEGLEIAMLQLFQAKKQFWYSVGVALQLFEFAKNKVENEGLVTYQLLRHKAAEMIKSQSRKRVEKSKEFKEFFKNDKSQMDLFTYLTFYI